MAPYITNTYGYWERRDGESILHIEGNDVLGWAEFVEAEIWDIYLILGDTFTVEVELYYVSRRGFWEKLPDYLFEGFMERCPPVWIRPINGENAVVGEWAM